MNNSPTPGPPQQWPGQSQPPFQPLAPSGMVPQTGYSSPTPEGRTASLIAIIILSGALIATMTLWLAGAPSPFAGVTSSQDLKAAAAEYGFTEASGDSEVMHLTLSKVSVLTRKTDLTNMLESLGFSAAVFERMKATRALDGTQTAHGENCNVSWTFHPDDGLNMVFEATN